MQNLLILFNPYYQKDVIDSHVAILKERGAVGFGKIKSKLTSLSTPKELDWDSLSSVSSTSPLQLFLTDYSSLFVAKVVSVSAEIDPTLTPSYYQEKGLEIEAWFIIADIIELVHKDFEKIRDLFLANFTTPDYGNHTYAIYGNSYQYPLKVEMKNEINYFLSKELFYPNIYKSDEFLSIKNNLISYVFGDLGYRLHPESLENLVFAEMEFEKNKEDKLYDFTGVAMRYGKALEMEAYWFFNFFLSLLMHKDKKVSNVIFLAYGQKTKVADFKKVYPSLGSYKVLLANSIIAKAIRDNQLKWVSKNVVDNITMIQRVRNHAAHQGKISLNEIEKMRNAILGIGENQVIFDFLRKRLEINKINMGK